MNPAIYRRVALVTIEKLKRFHIAQSEAEKARIRKRWCFAPGSAVWTVDFTTVLKTGAYKVQVLTVSDHRSRFLFRTAVFLDTSTECVIEHLVELFHQYGKPFIIKADNGPEFRLDCEERLRAFTVHLFNSPEYYGQFNASHERIHRVLKSNISALAEHGDFARLVRELDHAENDYNHHQPIECLGGKTPAEIFYGDDDFIPDGCEVITPQVKDGEVRMKFMNRAGGSARMTIPHIPGSEEAPKA